MTTGQTKEKIDIQCVDGRWVVAVDEVWVPGSYESKLAATAALLFTDEHLQMMQDVANKRAGGKGGVIALDDLDSAELGFDPKP